MDGWIYTTDEYLDADAEGSANGEGLLRVDLRVVGRVGSADDVIVDDVQPRVRLGRYVHLQRVASA